ncbi:hypothetical protein D1224_05775 [Henriciella barbarensis]|uniref:Class I SAM-dependent methyltransferase n=1 Tax=Henriciella barbarensis TaxID=86342 RepID=A0A399R2L5_9PROT|nr:methyltransferase domain-containing protein [Henriciella barbarensis]RIJ23769.1 hypothetical protein D1224_05775 [Henriciella barbarensis]
MSQVPATALFDVDNYIAINEARWAIADKVLKALRSSGMTLETAYDFGAGPGWFAKRLNHSDLNVMALEGRQEVAEVGRRRAPGCDFSVFDFDNCATSDALAPRDFALSFGILYHLENPLRALRMMGAMAGKAMLLETMIVPDGDFIGRVARENPNATQGIQPLAMILSRAALERGMWAAGFSNVYECKLPVEHDDFRDLETRHPRRGIWLLTHDAVSVPGFEPLQIEEPRREDYWRK